MQTALKNSRYICPVCGFSLKFAPADFNICPSCGVEFDADTVEYSIQELQAAWIERGMPWTSEAFPRPLHFDPIEQLRRLEPHPDAKINVSTVQIVAQFRPVASTVQRIGATSGRFHLRYA